MTNIKTVLFAKITEAADRWITEQATKQGISKNNVIQMLINEAMKKDTAQNPGNPEPHSPHRNRCRKESENMSKREILEEQLRLLADWNKENIKNEPEQVRLNIDTICNAFNLLSMHPGTC